ncbi:MAG: hypothetical protein K5990_04425 [Oscillospiraceae bacterium]|nr:hypothetical protein [Oscillospiraceae bacterium]
MNRNLRTLAAAAALVLVLSAGAAVVYAYLQHQTAQRNPFQIGTDTLEIQETFTPPPQMGMQNSVEKTVTVENTGTSNQFVRVFLDFSDSSARDRSRIVYTRGGGVQVTDWNTFRSAPPEGWVYVSEETDAVLGGYFYYTGILAPNAVTPPLIAEIRTDFGTGSNPDQITDFDVIVYSESVQTVETGTGEVYDTEIETVPAWKRAWTSFLNPS